MHSEASAFLGGYSCVYACECVVPFFISKIPALRSKHPLNNSILALLFQSLYTDVSTKC